MSSFCGSLTCLRWTSAPTPITVAEYLLYLCLHLLFCSVSSVMAETISSLSLVDNYVPNLQSSVCMDEWMDYLNEWVEEREGEREQERKGGKTLEWKKKWWRKGRNLCGPRNGLYSGDMFLPFSFLTPDQCVSPYPLLSELYRIATGETGRIS